MKITKIISTTIVIKPHELQASIDDLLLEKIKEKYSHRCFNGCLLLDNFIIKQRGDCVINKSELGGNMHVELNFSADAIIYSSEEWLIGKVITIKEGYFFVKGEHSITLVEYSKDFIKTHNIKVNSPIIFFPNYDGIRYTHWSNEITIIGIEMFYYPEPRVFRCSEHIDKEILEPYFEKVEELRARLPSNWKSIDAKLKKYKKTILEPIAADIKKPKGKAYKLADLKLVGNIIKPDLLLDEVYAYDGEATIIESGTKVYQAYLTDTINYIELILQYAKYF